MAPKWSTELEHHLLSAIINLYAPSKLDWAVVKSEFEKSAGEPAKAFTKEAIRQRVQRKLIVRGAKGAEGTEDDGPSTPATPKASKAGVSKTGTPKAEDADKGVTPKRKQIQAFTPINESDGYALESPGKNLKIKQEEFIIKED